MSDAIAVRLATAADTPVLARHRAEMFRDMGELHDDHYGALMAATERDLGVDAVVTEQRTFARSR